jgi:hypothetical protein
MLKAHDKSRSAEKSANRETFLACSGDVDVFMSGDIAALGKWDPAKAVRMEWSDDMHAYTTTIPLEPASHLNYKYALRTLCVCVCPWAEKRKGRVFVYISKMAATSTF